MAIVEASNIPLENTLIIWLPTDSTSRYQPLDQGIICSWKAYWKQKWIQFMLKVEDNKDPIKTMSVLHAV